MTKRPLLAGYHFTQDTQLASSGLRTSHRATLTFARDSVCIRCRPTSGRLGLFRTVMAKMNAALVMVLLAGAGVVVHGVIPPPRELGVSFNICRLTAEALLVLCMPRLQHLLSCLGSVQHALDLLCGPRSTHLYGAFVPGGGCCIVCDVLVLLRHSLILCLRAWRSREL